MIGGDFNVVCNPTLDKWNPKEEEQSTKAAVKLEEVKNTFNLNNVWRSLTPETKHYTW